MKAKCMEYVAELLPDGHLSLPEEIKKRLRRASAKSFKVSINVEAKKRSKEHHPAFGIWSDRDVSESSVELAAKIRRHIESRSDGTR